MSIIRCYSLFYASIFRFDVLFFSFCLSPPRFLSRVVCLGQNVLSSSTEESRLISSSFRKNGGRVTRFICFFPPFETK
uniref:Uncharacterized protein n=1 Tax=Daphnia magna TaxID=35525 RepID=A0A0P5LA59_9CRUS